MIRSANAADTDAAVAVIDAAYAPFISAGLDLPPVSEGIADDIQDHHVWVGLVEGRIMGVVVLVFSEVAHLANLAVHPDCAGHGLGSALIDTATKSAKDAGLGKITLTTHIAMKKTLALYERIGWTQVGQDGNKVYLEREL